MPLPVVPVKYCEHIKGKKPSEITPVMLGKLSCGGQMHHCAARSFEALMAKAKADGIIITPSSSGDTFRSIAQQKAGFLSRYTLTPVAGTSTRNYDGKVWYLKKGMAPLASPVDDPAKCSRHMLGIAVDVAGASGKRLEWMKANIRQFGFSWELQEEPWHIRWVDSTPSPAVLAYEASSKVGA